MQQRLFMDWLGLAIGCILNASDDHERCVEDTLSLLLDGDGKSGYSAMEFDEEALKIMIM